jgi:hypothetical protein
MTKIDLGCGAIKAPGFIGADRVQLPGVSVILDLNVPLPFADNSADLIVASHSLEHVRDLTATMQEIYRVCKPGAQLCILAPYSQQGLNYANPYHFQDFNEHTPRFWTTSTHSGVDPAEYAHPHAATWGLSDSDYSHPDVDLRCVRLEFFYFPAYRDLPPAAQRAARKKYLDVCDQLLYHLVVAKAPLNEADMQQITENLDYYVPLQVQARRAQDRADALEGQLAEAQTQLRQAQTELQEAQTKLQEAQIEVSRAHSEFQSRQDELKHTVAALRQAAQEGEHETDQLKSNLEARTADLRQAQAGLAAAQTSLGAANERAVQLASEVEATADRRILRLLDRFARARGAPQVAPAFQQLLDDSRIFSDIRGFQLQPSTNLQRVAFVSYPLFLGRANLKALLLAVILKVPHSDGRIGVEIVSAQKRIVAQAAVGLAGLTEAGPVRLDIPPFKETDRARFWLRVFVRDASLPVRIFEWRRYPLAGLGPAQARAFCGFVFDS